MAVNRIRADYAHLTQVAQTFTQTATLTHKTLDALQKNVDTLRQGDWVGQGATAFYQEMGAEVFPALKRLGDALEQAGRVTAQIKQLMQQAEADAARIFRLTETGGQTNTAGASAVMFEEEGGDGGGSGGGSEGSGSGGGAEGDPTSTVTGTVTRNVNLRAAPGTDAEYVYEDGNPEDHQLEPGDTFTVTGVTYDTKDGHRWLQIETANGDVAWIAADYAQINMADGMQGVQIYDSAGNPIPEAEQPLRQAQMEILLRYGIDLKINDGGPDAFRDPTVADTAVVQETLANLNQLHDYGVTLAPNGTGSSTDEWTVNDITQVHDAVVTQADSLYSFAEAHGFDVSETTPGEMYRNMYFEGKDITVYRNSAAKSPEGYYGYVTGGTITLYDNAFEGPFNIAGVTGRDFTTQLLMQHEVQHQADFDHSYALRNNFAALENGTYRFQNEYTINYTDDKGNPQTYTIARNPETGQLPTLGEVEDALGADVDLVNYGSAAYTGMDFVVASSAAASELPVDITLAAITGQGFRIGEGYSLAENVGAIVRQEWGEQQMVNLLTAEGYTQAEE